MTNASKDKTVIYNKTTTSSNEKKNNLKASTLVLLQSVQNGLRVYVKCILNKNVIGLKLLLC
jgi:hypothetical protein